ncbi:hypothetical protein PVL30_000504 [Lodderomyces elongisporus]|uniref:uncharacterized protein n=1 Tax=Lodderomyces elongisporus TaxID=36914 RepID=UPI00291D6CE3|nr:uncharacterized protein PVL30_000504 [Lodderomyces elongisporus]WLF76800.1 hypothetical protein PVL30_000504 [Lodderomyces elongisporus]
MLSRSIQLSAKSHVRVLSRQHISKRFNSSHSDNHHDDHHGHGHATAEEKPFEITIAKVFGLAAILGGLIMYKNKDSTDSTLFNSQLFEQVSSGQRDSARAEAYENRYKVGFMKSFIKDNGGEFGEQMYTRAKGDDIWNYTVIPAHSPFGQQIGAGIKLNEVGPRRERAPRFAPLQKTEQS